MWNILININISYTIIYFPSTRNLTIWLAQEHILGVDIEYIGFNPLHRCSKLTGLTHKSQE